MKNCYIKKFVIAIILVNILGCNFLSFNKEDKNIKEDKNTQYLNYNNISKSLKCSWSKESNFINDVPNMVRMCTVKFENSLSSGKNQDITISDTLKYKDCIFNIIKDFKNKFYNEKINNFSLENLQKSASLIGETYNEIYCRAFLCDETWKIIALGDSVKVYEDFLKNIYNIIMIDLEGNEKTCKDKRELLLKQVDILLN